MDKMKKNKGKSKKPKKIKQFKIMVRSRSSDIKTSFLTLKLLLYYYFISPKFLQKLSYLRKDY